MRIRKRKVPFPLSYLSPVPLSDPQFAYQLRLQSNPHPNFSPQDDKVPYFGPYSSDQPHHPIGDQDSPDFGCKKQQNKVLWKEGREDHKGEEKGEKSNNSRKASSLGAKTSSMVFQELTSFRPDGKWCEGEKALIPFKKRGGSFGRISSNGETVMEKDKKIKTKMKTKINKKYTQRKDEEGEEGEDSGDYKEISKKNVSTSSVKKKVRGGALMEGSRCSRVNGRGWRCCQPTLVGYSLCEHHLGKGRLRSMTSVRSRSVANATPKKVESHPLSGTSFSLNGEETKNHKVVAVCRYEEEKQLPLLMSKKKQKLGMVKARSISSLLGQPINAIEISEMVE